MGWSRSSRVGGGRWSTGLNALTAAWRDAATVGPSSGLLNAIDAYVVGSLADGDLTGVDWLVICATEDEQQARINLMAPSKVGTCNGTFTASQGWQGNSTDQSFAIGESVTAGGSYTQNSAMYALYCNLQTGSTGSAVHGGTSSGSLLRIQPSSAGTGSFNINATTTTTWPTPGNALRSGFRMVVRPDASNQIGYLNGAQAATAAVASTGTPAGGGGFLRFGSSTYGRDQIAAMMLGGAKDASAAGRMHTRIHTLMTALGAAYP